jgi:hypothetical protein
MGNEVVVDLLHVWTSREEDKFILSRSKTNHSKGLNNPAIRLVKDNNKRVVFIFCESCSENNLKNSSYKVYLLSAGVAVLLGIVDGCYIHEDVGVVLALC